MRLLHRPCLHLAFETRRPSGCSSRRHMFGSALFPDCTSDLSISAGRRAGAPGPAEKPTRFHKLDRLNRRISWPWWYSYSARPGLGASMHASFSLPSASRAGRAKSHGLQQRKSQGSRCRRHRDGPTSGRQELSRPLIRDSLPTADSTAETRTLHPVPSASGVD